MIVGLKFAAKLEASKEFEDPSYLYMFLIESSPSFLAVHALTIKYVKRVFSEGGIYTIMRPRLVEEE